MAKKLHEKTVSFIFWETQFKSTMRYHFIPTRQAETEE